MSKITSTAMMPLLSCTTWYATSHRWRPGQKLYAIKLVKPLSGKDFLEQTKANTLLLSLSGNRDHKQND